MTDKRYVFVDADSILYRAAYKAENDSQMFKRYRDRLMYIKAQTFATDIFVAVKGFDNFREKLDPEYKAQRPTLPDDLRERLRNCHAYAKEQGAVQCDGYEADDQVRMWAYEADQENIPWAIAGMDKDLLQIPGTHFDYSGSENKPLPEENKWHFITPEEGDFRFASQLLTGDTVDNIKGIKGIGPKKAEKLLTGLNRKQMMNEIITLYNMEYPNWEQKLYTNCNLIYMRRWPDDEFKYQEWLNG